MIHLEESIRHGVDRKQDRFPRVPDAYSIQVFLDYHGFTEVPYDTMVGRNGKKLGKCYSLGDYGNFLGTHWIRFQIVKNDEIIRFFLRTGDAAVPGSIPNSHKMFSVTFTRNNIVKNENVINEWNDFLKTVDDWLDDTIR